MNLEHKERHQWCGQVSRINKEMSADKKEQPLNNLSSR
jgi:hypothetical protein